MGDQSIVSAEVREMLDGNLADNSLFGSHAGFVGGQSGKLLSFLAQHYDGDRHEELPYRLEDTELFQAMVESNATERITEAVEDGNTSLMSFATGVTQRDVDASPVRALQQFQSLVRNAGQILVFAGGTNNGKNNVSSLGIELFKGQYPDGLVAANMESLSGVEYKTVRSFDELDEWTEKNRKREKFLLIDDASIDHMEGSANIHEVRERQGELVRLAAKRHCRIAYLGHRTNDITPRIRAMPDAKYFFCSRITDDAGKPEEYILNVFGELGDDGPEDHIMTLRNLPETGLSYDADEEALNLFA